MAEDKQFTVKDLERAGERGIVLGQIAVVEQIISDVRTQARGFFESGEDDAAKAMRDYATALAGGLLTVLQQKKEGLASKVRSQQITDTVIDATLEVQS
jgi:mRNA degradation ribonuclease J1/J2